MIDWRAFREYYCANPMEDTVDRLYRNAVCLAPMVRVGTLPMRLLTLRYGADAVYGEEIIDRKITKTKRIENKMLDTIDYIGTNGTGLVFRTCQEEKKNVVYQIGTSNATYALQAASHVARDVAAIDINMGCPKPFSMKGGMGAALLQKPELAEDIIKTLRRNLSIPVSCKIRLLGNEAESIQYAQQMEKAGAQALGIHARTVKERPSDPAQWCDLKAVCDSVQIPTIANGDIFYRHHIDQIRDVSNSSSVMIARGAILNPSIFRAEGTLPVAQVVREYMHLAIETDNVYQNTKYNISRMAANTEHGPEYDLGISVAEIGATKTADQMYELFGLGKIYDAKRSSLTSAIQTTCVREYDEAHVLRQECFCEPCGKQLSSVSDLLLHQKGKKHKKKMRSLAALTLSERASKRIKA